MFEHRNRMTKIPYNIGNKEEKCVCGNLETISHIYSCKFLNKKEFKIQYNEFYNGNLEQQIEIFRRLEKSLEIRNEIKARKDKFPCDLSDPPYCDQYGFG